MNAFVCTVERVPVLMPTSVDQATAGLAAHPEAMLLAGGTDAMVEINDGVRRPGTTVIATGRIGELRSWRHDAAAATVTIGAAITWTELMTPPLSELVPALAEAARTVGSPQIRNAGTLGGNLATCSPAGDGLPVLAALDATVTVASTDGRRTMPVAEFMVGVKRTALRPGELIVEVTLPVVAGWQGYAKVGVRNAMVIAIASACFVVDHPRRRVALALGSVGPTVLRCKDGERELSAAIDWDRPSVPLEAIGAFGRAAAATARPITDHRATAEYRTHAVDVLARRLVRRAFPDREAR